MKDLISRSAVHSVVTQIRRLLPPELWSKVIAIYMVGSYARGGADKQSDLDIWVWVDAYNHDKLMFPDKTPRIIQRILGPSGLKVITQVAHNVPLEINVYAYHPPTDHSREILYYSDDYDFV